MRQAGLETGFAPPATRPFGRERRTVAVAELLTSIALATGTLIAATVITAGIAHADGLAPIAGRHGSLVSLAVMLSLLFAGMGGLTFMSFSANPIRRRSLRD